MSFKRTIKRFAHVNGFTHVSYSEDGEYILTAGSADGDIRIWKEISDDDPASHCVGESANCCAHYVGKHPRLLVSTDNNLLQAYTFPEGDRDGIEFRFTAPITTIKINKNWVAAGSEDFTIKVQKRDKSEEYFELKGHEGPVLHIDLSPNDQLASSSGDGTIRIWDLKKCQMLKKFEGFNRINSFPEAKIFSTPSFEASGRYLAYPKGSIIHVLDTANWESKFKLQNDEVTGVYSVCSISKCGTYVAAGSLNGEVAIWNLVENSKLKGDINGEDDHPITSLAWNPKNNGELAFCDADGQLSTVVTGVKSNGFFDDEADEEPNEKGIEDDPDDLYNGIDFRDDPADEDNDNCIALEKLKNKTLKTDIEDIDSDDDDSKTIQSEPASRDGVTRYPVAKPFQVQPPFQPGATPIHLEHRFMVWNHVGQVISHSGEENSIIAEFHDVTVHPSLHILNQLNHEMATLSTTCLALATKQSPCKLVCIALVASGSKEWSTTMPDCEEIMAIAAGESFVAVATDAEVIRFYTTMGTQREVIAVPGPVVAMSASDNKLVVAFHTSNTYNKLSVMIITCLGLTMINRTVDMPLSPNTKLAWLGFSDAGSIITSDTAGRVLSYSIKKNLWYPICDMMTHISGASDNFFIISVSEREQKIRVTLCRGINYPLTNPRPIMREIDFCMPLGTMETEKSKLEEALVRASNFCINSSEKLIVENGLKLFSTAMNAELESRAYEIVELIGDKKLIELAAKYASQKGRIHMAGKIAKLLNDFEEKEKEKQAILNSIEHEVELFTGVYETPTPQNVEQQRQETSTPIIAPKPMNSQRKANPFKKSNGASKLTPINPLNHLTKKSIGHSDSNATNSDDENMPVNSLKPVINRSLSADTPRPGNFSGWFCANKVELLANHPDVAEGDLIKVARGLYKELTKHQKPPETEDIATESLLPCSKRKLDMNDDVNAGGVSKLAKYGFTQD